MMNSSSWIFITTLLASTLFEAKCEIQECGFQGIDLQQCLDQGTQMSAPELCCKSLNQAIQVGYYCICKLIGSTTPLLTNSIVLPMPNCFISIPPLNQCQEPWPVLEPPPVSPQKMQPSAPKMNDSSLDSTLSNGSSSVVTSQQALVPRLGDLENGIVLTSCGGNKKGIWLLTGTLLLAAVLHVCSLYEQIKD
nr:RNA-binding protein 26-like [Ipomoea batatas]GME06306.1 RNA-binding protein 26-like [Ipomoea batatas]